MKKILLGKTGLAVTKTGFGVLPIQRVSFDEAKHLLTKAYNAGINFYDTARAYSDSEEKIGYSLSGVRENIIIATKTHCGNVKEFWEHLETSLEKLKTSYIDIYQFHNPSILPMPNDGTELYEAMLEAKSLGKIRHIGITSHKMEIAKKAIESGLYETLQYPLSHISSQNDIDIYNLCVEHGVGYIAMKALCGGLLNNAKVAYSFFEGMDKAVPIWGVQRESELDDFIEYSKNPPEMKEEIKAQIKKDRKELASNFCRGCGYCLPCPVGIPINNAARMAFLLRRAVWQGFVTPEWQNEMKKIEDCIECGQCKEKCPYGLDTPNLLKYMLGDYNTFIKENI